MDPRRTRTHGFSLIELVVIVSVVGIFAAIAVPNFLRWQANERVKASARAVADSFNLARSEALRTGNRFLVVLDGALSAPAPIAVVDDGPEATANCSIDAGELLHADELEGDVGFGTGPAGSVLAPEDEGGLPANSATGSTFTDGGGDAATWVLFQSDGLPRTFTNNGGTCSAVGPAAAGGGGIYLSNGDRDYAVVLRPLGTARVHRWRSADGWSD